LSSKNWGQKTTD